MRKQPVQLRDLKQVVIPISDEEWYEIKKYKEQGDFVEIAEKLSTKLFPVTAHQVARAFNTRKGSAKIVSGIIDFIRERKQKIEAAKKRIPSLSHS